LSETVRPDSPKSRSRRIGKTFNMLSEGIRRHSRGEDVVIDGGEQY